jgi:hypothetical protein
MAVFTPLILLSGLVFILASPASANEICGARTGHWSIQSGPSWSPKVGWIEMTITTCSNGNIITKTSATGDSDVTGPGKTAGFVVHNGPPALVSSDSGGFDGGYAKYYEGGSLRDCLPGGITWWCSPSYDFSVRGKVTMLNAINWDYSCSGFCVISTNKFSLHHRIFVMSWWWVCKNKICTNCGVRLNGVCKSTYS